MIASRLRFLMALAIASLATQLSGAPELPAFLGAQGFGAPSRGGRGGDVFIVSNLNPKGPGSFSEAISTVPPQGRTILFSVSGIIPINKARLTSPFVTIAGQSAPGDGICLRGSSFTISASDVVIRHLRFRHGKKGNGGDCINPDGNARNLIIDHCDVMFGADENLSSFRTPPPTFTFQWSTNAWGIYGHSCGGLWNINHATVHHTLWANNKTRNPKVIFPTLLDWTNNVSFGWDIGMNLAGADQPGTYKVNLRGSSFIRGSAGRNAIFGGGVLPDGSMPYHVFMEDCALDGNGSTPPDVTATNYELIDQTNYHKSTTPFPQESGVPITVEDRISAYKKVISQVGPLRLDLLKSRPLRDEVTTLLVSDVVRQFRRKISDEAELGLPNGGFGNFNSDPPLPDSDQDGMPDVWETTLGWNPRTQDHNLPLPQQSFISEGNGYTRLEEYLHFLATPHAILPSKKNLVIDLTKLTSGFTLRPRFSCSKPSGGTLSRPSPESPLVTFTPAPGFSGRAGFIFKVTDAEGSSMTQPVQILVTP